MKVSGRCSGAKWLTPGSEQEAGAGNGAGEIFGVRAVDELVMLALDDEHWNVDAREIGGAVVGLGALHQADGLGEGVEIGGGGRERGIVGAVAGDAVLEGRAELEFLRAARVHVAGKEEDAGDPVGVRVGEQQRDAGAVAPADEGGAVDAEMRP